MARTFTFLAALRYFSDSERSDVERCDISEKAVSATDARLADKGPTIQRVSSPKEFFHIFRHYPGDVLKLIVKLIQARAPRGTGSPGIPV